MEILESCAPTLKSSGILTYSTCTILKEENQDVVSAFLERHPDFERIDVLTNPMLQSSIEENVDFVSASVLHRWIFHLLFAQKVMR